MYSRQNRILCIYGFFFIFFMALILRICYIVIVDGDQYTKLAVSQRERTVDLMQHPRGDILDRDDYPITNKEQQPCIVVFPVMIKDFSQTTNFLCERLGIPAEVVKAKLGTRKKESNQYIVKNPFILKSNVTEWEIQQIKSVNLPGVFVLPMIPRYQPQAPAVHLLGFMGYGNNEVVGKAGLEKQYEEYLKNGTSRRIATVIDGTGKHMSGLGFTLLPPKKEQENINNVVLTLDLQYQQIVEEELGKYHGAAVVMDANNGDILAMASSPKFDPYLLETPETDDAYLNKALASYPPASVFKILIAIAALEEKIVEPESLFNCTGQIIIPGGSSVSCWKKEGHGNINFMEALSYSCNPVFIELGLKLGGDIIKKYARGLGLLDHNIIGYNLPESSNINFHSLVPGDIANVSIGENGVKMSPVMMAKLVSQVANGGLSVTPRIVKRIQDDNGKIVKYFSLPSNTRVMSSETSIKIKEMLRNAVENGTGKSAQVLGVETAGKTGSSQSGGVWFAGFAPLENPKWVVVIYIEQGTSGGKEAAPVFQKIISRFAHLEGIAQ